MQLPKTSILITLMICLFGVNPAMAEPGDQSTPTSRILAIGTVNPGDAFILVSFCPAERNACPRETSGGAARLNFFRYSPGASPVAF